MEVNDSLKILALGIALQLDLIEATKIKQWLPNGVRFLYQDEAYYVFTDKDIHLHSKIRNPNYYIKDVVIDDLTFRIFRIGELIEGEIT